jgi:hypothetical protein
MTGPMAASIYTEKRGLPPWLFILLGFLIGALTSMLIFTQSEWGKRFVHSPEKKKKEPDSGKILMPDNPEQPGDKPDTGTGGEPGDGKEESGGKPDETGTTPGEEAKDPE